MRYALILVFLAGCAVALGDNSRATSDVKINSYPSVDIDATEPKRSKQHGYDL